jgi:N-succinyldiaminopimelate aminotransferase
VRVTGSAGRDETAGDVRGPRPLLASRFQGFGVTIFAEMSMLAERTGSINLGQGFPDSDGPAAMAEAAIKAIREGHNQYPPGPGTPELRRAIAAHQKRFYGLEYDPDSEVLVTAGATEAIAAAMLALCEPTDEVVMFEPTYDSYAPAVAMAGAYESGGATAAAVVELRRRRACCGHQSANSPALAQFPAQSHGKGI